MLVDFKVLPESSRVWIYQANRSFTSQERFIILALDQTDTAASGCSIDASVHFIQHLEKKYKVELLDKMNVSYKQGEFIAYKPLIEFKKMAKQRAVSLNTVVFNNLVTNKGEYLEHWEVPASESWHSRFM